jgi:hypothetical protein
MAIKYATGLRNTRITAVLTAIDAGGAAGSITFYGGTPFVNTTALAVLDLNYPCGTVTASTGVVLNFDVDPVLTGTGTAAAGSAGTVATWARIKTSAGATVVDLTVGQTGETADIILTNKTIVTAGEVSITAGSFTEGNA